LIIKNQIESNNRKHQAFHPEHDFGRDFFYKVFLYSKDIRK